MLEVAEGEGQVVEECCQPGREVEAEQHLRWRGHIQVYEEIRQLLVPQNVAAPVVICCRKTSQQGLSSWLVN